MEGHVFATHQWNQTLAFDVRGNRQTGQFAEGRIHIEKLGQGSDPFATGDTGSGNDQRCAGGVFVVGQLAPMPVLTEMPAVVAPEADDGVIRHAAFRQRLHEQADLRINVGDAGGVAVDQFTLLRFGDWPRLGHIRVIAQLARVAVKSEVVQTSLWELLERRERKSVAVVEIPVFLRRDEGQVRLHETDREEEGLFFVGKLPDALRCRVGHTAVVVGVVREVAGLRRRA